MAVYVSTHLHHKRSDPKGAGHLAGTAHGGAINGSLCEFPPSPFNAHLESKSTARKSAKIQPYKTAVINVVNKPTGAKALLGQEGRGIKTPFLPFPQKAKLGSR